MIKLNLGCGMDCRENFINTDIREDIETDLVCDVSKLSFRDNSVDFILASDILEHFSWRRTDDILKEWFRVLKKDGQLYVRVPDLQRWANVLLLKHRLPGDVIMNIFGGQEYEENTHKSIFTKEILLEKLHKIGFKNIRIGDTQQQYGLNMEALAQK